MSTLDIAGDYIKPVQRALGFTGNDVDGDAGPDTWKAIRDRLAPVAEQSSAAQAVEGDKVDARSEVAIATLKPAVRPLARELVRQAAGHGIEVKVTSGLRTYAEQDALYAQGRSRPGKIVTNARGGYSNHNFGLAFDLTIFAGGAPVWESPKYKTLGSIGKSLGLQWGGDFASIKDEPHFEYNPKRYTLAQLRERKASGAALV